MIATREENCCEHLPIFLPKRLLPKCIWGVGRNPQVSQVSPSIFRKKTLVNLFTLAASPLSRGIDVQLCVRIGWLAIAVPSAMIFLYIFTRCGIAKLVLSLSPIIMLYGRYNELTGFTNQET